MKLFNYKDGDYVYHGVIVDLLRWTYTKTTGSKWFNAVTLRRHYQEEYSRQFNNKVDSMVQELEKQGTYTHVITGDLRDTSITGRILMVGDGISIFNNVITSGTFPAIEVKNSRTDEDAQWKTEE